MKVIGHYTQRQCALHNEPIAIVSCDAKQLSYKKSTPANGKPIGHTIITLSDNECPYSHPGQAYTCERHDDVTELCILSHAYQYA